jgi:hypothetical protein
VISASSSSTFILIRIANSAPRTYPKIFNAKSPNKKKTPSFLRKAEPIEKTLNNQARTEKTWRPWSLSWRFGDRFLFFG